MYFSLEVFLFLFPCTVSFATLIVVKILIYLLAIIF